MALINCSMNTRSVVVTSGSNNVASVTLEITPDDGYVIAARDFVAGANPDDTKINSITLSDSETTGGPQNDGSYTANNKVEVLVDFKNDYAPTENITLDIDPSGIATAEHLVPVKLQGTFAVPASPNKVTFTASNVLDFASSASTADFYAYDNPGNITTIMVMTIAATSGDFIDEDSTIEITNASNSAAAEDYTITRVNTFDSSDRLTQIVYTVKATMPNSNRSNDVITFTGAGADIPGVDNKIYGFNMNTNNADNNIINRRLEINADSGSKFRIKMERGVFSGDPEVFTVDSTDGIYVFDNTNSTIASAFYPSTSTVTYPSEINSSGNYIASTDPFTVDSTGLFYKDIIIPADSTDKAYRFTITPQATTVIDLNAIGIDTSPDPDVITFDIRRSAEVYIEGTYSSASDRSNLTDTTEYYNYQDVSKGTVKPVGQAESEVNSQINTYDYEIVITDDVDFHLPNQANEFVLSELNYTKTLNSGLISDPTITAELRANDDGFNTGEINSTESSSHETAGANDILTTITLTIDQREALTSKNSFSAQSFKDDFTVTGDDGFFKIHFFTTDETPVYKSQTIRIFSDYQVQGGETGQQNTTTISSPAVNRSKLYITANDLSISKWGNDNMSIRADLDTFAFTSSQSINTLNVHLGVTQGVRKFVNDLIGTVGYVYNEDYYLEKEVFNSGDGDFSKQNITQNTERVKYTISGAFLIAQDGLPSGFDINDYELVFEPANYSSVFSSVTVSVDTSPTLTLNDGSTNDRKLSMTNFVVIIDFGSTLSSLSTSENYFYNTNIVHKLSDNYKEIEDIEAEYFIDTPNPELARY